MRYTWLDKSWLLWIESLVMIIIIIIIADKLLVIITMHEA